MHKNNTCDTLQYDKSIKEEIDLKNSIKTLAVWLIVGIILLFVIPAVLDTSNKELTYSELITRIEAGEVSDIEIEYGGESAKVKLKNDSNIKILV